MTSPNIIYILADDMGYGDVSCLNENSRIQTRNLDRLAVEGMRFTDAHASSAVCTPSRYSILTGRYNWRSSLKQRVLFGYDGPLIEERRTTAASMLRSVGYHSACIGKWHLGWSWARNGADVTDVDFTRPIQDGPTTRGGFDYFYGIAGSLDMPPYVYVENDMPTAVPDHSTENKDQKSFWREGPTAPDFEHETVLDNFTQRACDYIESRANRETPFFLYLPLTAPHTPIVPSNPFLGKSGTNEYGDFCLHLDDCVGRVMKTLEDAGISDNTILIFASDNGCSPYADFDELARVGHHPSYVFRGYKADIYEGGHRIPYIIRWPNQIQPSQICDETVCLVDLLATCADLLDITLPDCAGEDSVSNLSLWKGQSITHSLREATVHHSVDGSFSIRRGHWKLEFCPGSGGWSDPRPGEETDDMPPMQLYNLNTDISERENVLSEFPDVVKELTELMTRYVCEGRSTPGLPQKNTGPAYWPQLRWMSERDVVIR
jgi:arylsulfatase A